MSSSPVGSDRSRSALNSKAEGFCLLFRMGRERDQEDWPRVAAEAIAQDPGKGWKLEVCGEGQNAEAVRLLLFVLYLAFILDLAELGLMTLQALSEGFWVRTGRQLFFFCCFCLRCFSVFFLSASSSSSSPASSSCSSSLFPLLQRLHDSGVISQGMQWRCDRALSDFCLEDKPAVPKHERQSCSDFRSSLHVEIATADPNASHCLNHAEAIQARIFTAANHHIYLFIYLSIYLSIYVSLYTSIHIYCHMCMYIHIYTYTYVHAKTVFVHTHTLRMS